MKKIELLTLRLRNFKGVTNYEVKLNGKNAAIYGDNATGKTTLFDSFLWLLFNKDSSNRSDFEIKTIDKSTQQPLHKLEHEVEADFLVDSLPVTLKKIYKEIWTKKRGSAFSEHTGHETEHFIDGVPKAKKDYDSFVSQIVQEDLFKLLTSPLFFNEKMKWQDRRNILLSVCGDMTDEEVIDSNKALFELKAILNGKNIDDFKKMIASQKSNINEQLKMIPVRIDEVLRQRPVIDGLSQTDLTSQEKALNDSIELKKKEISDAQSGSLIAEKQRQILEIENQMAEYKRDFQQKSLQLKQDIQTEISVFGHNIEAKDRDINFAKSNVEANKKAISNLATKKESLLKEWYEWDEKEFIFTGECECPTCGQDLPMEQVDVARQKALDDFNLTKSKKLEDINISGKSLAEEIQTHMDNINKSEQSIVGLEEEKAKLQQALNDANTELAKLIISDVTADEKYQELFKSKEEISDSITQLRISNADVLSKLNDELSMLNSQSREISSNLGKFSAFDASEKRLAELEQQEKELGKEFEKLEQQLFLVEEFMKSKVNLLESKINSKFQVARFKLFDEQVNGGLKDCCETIVNGVTFANLNNGMKINVGIDIIRTLSNHYGIYVPIFIDNAESVTKLSDSDSQLIQLVVSEKDKSLRVEF